VPDARASKEGWKNIEQSRREGAMSQNILLFIIGVSGAVLVFTGARLWLSEHDSRLLRERRVVMVPESSGAGCLAVLVVLGAGLLWAYLGLGW
jgi:hypothetical protein